MDTSEIAELRNAVRQHVSASREQRFCYRALCVLLIAEGHRTNQVAEWLGEHTRTLERWRKRYSENGLEGLIDETSPGRPPKLSSGEWKRLQLELGQPPGRFGLEGKKWQGKLLRSTWPPVTGSISVSASVNASSNSIANTRPSLLARLVSSGNYTSSVGRIGTE